MKLIRIITGAAAAVTSLSLVLGGPVNVAADSVNNPRSPIQQGNSACGADLAALPVIGSVNYHRSGNTVTIQYHLKNGRPNEDYQVQLWGDTCSFFGILGTITTNKKGVGNLNGSVDVPAATTRIFATSFNAVTGFSNTPAVTLAP